MAPGFEFKNIPKGEMPLNVTLGKSRAEVIKMRKTLKPKPKVVTRRKCATKKKVVKKKVANKAGKKR